MKELPKELEVYLPDEDPVYEMMVSTPPEETKATICVSEELLEHYEAVIKARDEILNDSESSGGEKSSIINSTTAVLKDLLKMLEAANNADTVARLQQAVYNSLQEASPELKEKVLTLLEKHLEQV